MRRIPLSFLQWSLILTQGAGSPLPSATDDEEHHSEKRAIIGDAPLEDWEIALLILGALFGIMLIGAVGGICEVVLAGRIKESNAEADAKLEANANRAFPDEVEGGKLEGTGEVIDQDRYSWQPERMTTGLSDDSTLAGSDPGVSQSDISQGERAMTEGYGGSEGAQQAVNMPWTSEGLPLPDSSQFVIDDVDSPGYGETHSNAQSYEAYPGHLNPPPPIPRDNSMQDQDAEDQYWQEGNNGANGTGSSQAQYTGSSSDGYTEPSTMAPPGAYSGEGYSPAVMPDSADYLSEYRQSQLYLQQDDDWYTAAQATYGAPAGAAR